MQIEAWQLVVAIAALACTLLLSVSTVVVSVIGYFLRSWMSTTKDDLACLPEIKAQLAVIGTENRHLRESHNEFRQSVEAAHRDMWKAIRRREGGKRITQPPAAGEER